MTRQEKIAELKRIVSGPLETLLVDGAYVDEHVFNAQIRSIRQDLFEIQDQPE